MSTIEIPFVGSLDIDASDAEPKWISSGKHDLHGCTTRGGPLEQLPFVLFAGREPMLIVEPVRISESSGMASSVHVRTTWPAGARVHTRARSNK